MTKLTGKTALITGGSSGIGLATARLLVSEGAQVLITGRDAEGLRRAASELGPSARGVVADAARLQDLDVLATETERLGGLDLLFLNAGIPGFAPFEQVSENILDSLWDINAKGAYLTAQRLLPHLRPGGSVLLTTSAVHEKGVPGASAYAMTKAALRSLTRSLAVEFLPKKIRVNAISPGPIDTPIFARGGRPEEVVAAIKADFTERNPMKRFGQADEVAKAALFLAFDATYTTGAELPVDGGFGQL